MRRVPTRDHPPSRRHLSVASNHRSDGVSGLGKGRVRRRDIDPSFFSSDQVVACSMAARLLFIGTWMIADREGLLRDEPTRIRRHIFPDDAVDIDALLAELERVGLIDRYLVDDVACIAIPAFKQRQHIHVREQPSKLPQPPRDREKARLGTPKANLGLAKVAGKSGPSVSQAFGKSGPSVEGSPNGDSSNSPSRFDVQAVWNAWITATGRSRSKLDDKRRRLIHVRLNQFSVDDLVAAVRGWKHDPWPDRVRQNGIEILLRDGAHIEKFRDLELGHETAGMPINSMSEAQREFTDRMAAQLRAETRQREEALR